MRNRREFDREIVSENIAIRSIDQGIGRRPYRWQTREAREVRDEWVMELWAMDWSREQIAAEVDLTPQRVSQIVHRFGARWR